MLNVFLSTLSSWAHYSAMKKDLPNHLQVLHFYQLSSNLLLLSLCSLSLLGKGHEPIWFMFLSSVSSLKMQLIQTSPADVLLHGYCASELLAFRGYSGKISKRFIWFLMHFKDAFTEIKHGILLSLSSTLATTLNFVLKFTWLCNCLLRNDTTESKPLTSHHTLLWWIHICFEVHISHACGYDNHKSVTCNETCELTWPLDPGICSQSVCIGL